MEEVYVPKHKQACQSPSTQKAQHTMVILSAISNRFVRDPIKSM